MDHGDRGRRRGELAALPVSTGRAAGPGLPVGPPVLEVDEVPLPALELHAVRRSPRTSPSRHPATPRSGRAAGRIGPAPRSRRRPTADRRPGPPPTVRRGRRAARPDRAGGPMSDRPRDRRRPSPAVESPSVESPLAMGDRGRPRAIGPSPGASGDRIRSNWGKFTQDRVDPFRVPDRVPTPWRDQRRVQGKSDERKGPVPGGDDDERDRDRTRVEGTPTGEIAGGMFTSRRPERERDPGRSRPGTRPGPIDGSPDPRSTRPWPAGPVRGRSPDGELSYGLTRS